MSIDNEVNDFLDGGGPTWSWKDREIGEVCKGTISAAKVRNQTDPVSGEIKEWPDGSPKKQIEIRLVQDDGEEVRLFVQGQGRNALRDALQKAEASALEVGAVLAMQLIERKPQTNKALNPQNIFKAEYRAPTRTAVTADSLI